MCERSSYSPAWTGRYRESTQPGRAACPQLCAARTGASRAQLPCAFEDREAGCPICSLEASTLPETTESATCEHRRVTQGHGAVYECLDCEVNVSAAHMQAMQAEEGVTPDPFGFLESHYALPVDDRLLQPCPHLRVPRQVHMVYTRGAAPLEAHQCLGCGEPVLVEDVAVRRRSCAGSGDGTTPLATSDERLSGGPS